MAEKWCTKRAKLDSLKNLASFDAPLNQVARLVEIFLVFTLVLKFDNSSALYNCLEIPKVNLKDLFIV